MRLLGSRLFGVLAITAGLLTPLAAGQTDPGDVSPITFDQASFAASDSKQPIFRHQEIQLFYFSTATNIQVTEVVLYNGSTVVSSAKPPAVTTPIALVATARDDLHRGIRRAEAKEGDYGLAVNASTGQGAISFNSTSLSSSFPDMALNFRVEWKNPEGGTSGYTYSRGFVYINSDAERSSVFPLVSATSAVSPATTFPGPSTSTTAATAAATVAATAAATTKTPATTTAAAASTESSDPSGTMKSTGKKGLGGGAIAGIVIGVIAGLAIIGSLLFFFYRRRRASGRLSGSAASYRGFGGEKTGLQSVFASAATVQKEGIAEGNDSGLFTNTNSGAHIPYSDDNGIGGIDTGAHAGQAESARSAGTSPTATTSGAINLSTPTLPVAGPTIAQPVSTAAAIKSSTALITEPTAASPPAPPPKPAVSDQVAALIEEDMTAEDVARLEAEERELDLAIENAMRNRQSSQPLV